MSKEKITIENAELLCRIAWRDAKIKRIDSKEAGIDSWLILTFDNEFSKCNKSSSNPITKKMAQNLCKICWWDAKVNSETYSAKIHLWLEKEFSKIVKKYQK